MTENQQMLYDMACRSHGKWVDISGVCLKGQFTGRGIQTVIKSLESKGLIESGLKDVGTCKRLYRFCIRLKEQKP